MKWDGNVGGLNVESSRRTPEASDESGSLHSSSMYLNLTLNTNTSRLFIDKMTDVQTQPQIVQQSKVESHEVDKDALVRRLDELLEKYLHTLDKYQKTREQLSKQLSSVSNASNDS